MTTKKKAPAMKPGEGRKANGTDFLVSQRLRAFREGAGRTQEWLSERMGITFQQLQKYESAKNRISAGKLFAAAEALEVDVREFFPHGHGDLAALVSRQAAEIDRLKGKISAAARGLSGGA